MPHDYIKKEPTKTEKFMYELAMHQQQLESQTFSNSMTVLAVALALGADADKVAKFLTSDEEKIKEFGKSINMAIDKFKESKEPPKAVEEFKPKAE
jgi:tryptophanyl-tRNA synthetase